jgi:hypothetical protein
LKVPRRMLALYWLDNSTTSWRRLVVNAGRLD